MSRQEEVRLRARYRLWLRFIGILWGWCLGPVATADAPVAPVSVCQRTPGVRDALVRATCPRCTCAQITPAQLAALRELNLRQLGLVRFKPGDFSGLSALETLDLTGNRLQSLPVSLPSELSALKSMRMDLSLFTRLPDEVVTPLLDRPGFKWNMARPDWTCRPYDEPTPQEEFHLPDAELQSILQLPALFGQVNLREWKRGIYLAGVTTHTGDLDISGIHRGAGQRLLILAKTEKPILLSGWAYAFDLAPYRLSPNEIGFGMRHNRNATMASRLLATEEELQVFRLHGGKIEQVLRTVVYTHHERIGPPKGAPEEEDTPRWYWQEESCSIIAVARSKTRGVFNWVKVQSSSTTREKTAEEQQQPPFPAVVFRWTGERFEAPGDTTASVLFEED